MEYYENVDKLTDKQKEIEVAQKEADKWMMISDTAKLQTERAEFELEEAEKLKKELLGSVDGDDYLKEQVIELRYQNQILKEENHSLKDKLEKAYEFMKQFVIGGILKWQVQIIKRPEYNDELNVYTWSTSANKLFADRDFFQNVIK